MKHSAHRRHSDRLARSRRDNATETGTRDICAVLPARDEASSIAPLVRALRGRCRWVLVVDDGSRDQTADLARLAGAEVLSQPVQSGKGASIRRAIRSVVESPRHRDCEALLFLDADGQHPVESAEQFIAEFDRGARFVIGDRSAEFRRMSRCRELTNRCMTRVLNYWTDAAWLDSQCGYRLLASDLARALVLESGHFETESEMLFEVRRLRARVAQVPIPVVPSRRPSRIRPLRDTLRFLRLLALRRRLHGPSSSPGNVETLLPGAGERPILLGNEARSQVAAAGARRWVEDRNTGTP